MSVRAAASGIGSPRYSRKPQPGYTICSWQIERPHWGRRAHVGAQAGTGIAGSTEPDAKKASLPDPWAITSTPPQTDSALVASSSAATVEASPEASSRLSAPLSPWDATAAGAGVSSSAPHTAASTSGVSGANGQVRRSRTYDGYGPAAVVEAAAAPSAATEGAQSASRSGGTDASAAPATTATPAATATTASSTSKSIPRGSNGRSPQTGSSNGAGGGGGGGAAADSVRSRRAASAGLSEDTAALLARLRAELARTSNTPMPPARRTSNGTSVTSNGTSSTAGNGTAAARSAASTGNGAGRAEPGTPLSPPLPSKSKAAAAAVAAAAAEAPAAAAAHGAPPAAPAAAAAAAAAANASKPDTAAMSKEALAAALAAAGMAVPGSLPSGGSGAGSGAADAAAPSSSSPAGGFLGALIKRKQQRDPAAAAAAAPAAAAPVAAAPVAAAPAASAPSSPSAPTTPQFPPPASNPPAASRLAANSAGGGGGGGGGAGGRKRRAVVVGGGIGGLVSAARLAKEGFSVTLLEANSQVGGRCQSTQRGRFRFDTGPSLLLFVETYRKAFAALGTSLAQQVPVVRVTPAAYRVFFQGAGSLDMLYDVQRMVEQLEGVEKGAGTQYLGWLSSARAALQLGMEAFIERDADSLPELIGRALQDGELRSLLASVGVPELLGPHNSRMSRRFCDPRLRAMFTFQDLYVGLSPYTAPGVYSLLAATELTDGVWYPLGGFGQIRDALLRVGQGLGVRVRCGARVTAVRTAPASSREGGSSGGPPVVTGVTLSSGEELEADIVVSNRDVPLSYELLRGPAETHGSAQARRLLAADYSAGVIAFNWSVNRKVEQLLHHNVFLSGDFEGSWSRASSPDTLPRSPNFYVHCPARTDPTACPPGSDSIMVLLPVANIQEIVKAQEAERRRGSPLASLPLPLQGPLGGGAAGLMAAAAAAAAGSVGGGTSAPSSSPSSSSAAEAEAVDYSALVAAGREAVFRSMAEAGITDVRQHIVDELVIDPVEWRDRYSLAHGAAFGLSHGLSQLSVFRPGLSDKQVRGLYHVGASTRPGNGVPLTMISADLLTQRVMQDVAAGVI